MPRWPSMTIELLESRFWRWVDKNGPVVRPELGACWVWIGAKHGRVKTYGSIWANGKPVKAHHVSWELATGPIPPGLHVLHRCDNYSCVNPAHLFLGTNDENHRDKALKNRGKKKLEISDVLEIRRLAAEGIRQTELARRFNLLQSTVSRIVRRERRVHIGGNECLSAGY